LALRDALDEQVRYAGYYEGPFIATPSRDENPPAPPQIGGARPDQRDDRQFERTPP
jgi:hypothetical protein